MVGWGALVVSGGSHAVPRSPGRLRASHAGEPRTGTRLLYKRHRDKNRRLHVAHKGPRLIPKRAIGGLGVGKIATTRAQLDGWLRIYGHDPAQVVWVVGPDGTQTWD